MDSIIFRPLLKSSAADTIFRFDFKDMIRPFLSGRSPARFASICLFKFQVLTKDNSISKKTFPAKKGVLNSMESSPLGQVQNSIRSFTPTLPNFADNPHAGDPEGDTLAALTLDSLCALQFFRLSAERETLASWKENARKSILPAQLQLEGDRVKSGLQKEIVGRKS